MGSHCSAYSLFNLMIPFLRRTYGVHDNNQYTQVSAEQVFVCVLHPVFFHDSNLQVSFPAYFFLRLHHTINLSRHVRISEA